MTDEQASRKAERRAYRAVRNLLLNEMGVSRETVRTAVAAEVSRLVGEAVGQLGDDLVRVAIEREVGRRMMLYRGAGQGEFREAVNRAILAEVQRVVGSAVASALAGLHVALSTEPPPATPDRGITLRGAPDHDAQPMTTEPRP